MTLWTLVKQSLAHYWRTNLGVLLAAIVGTAVLAGALFVGDSVRYSLVKIAVARLGSTQLALRARERSFTTQVAENLAAELDTETAPVLQTQGLVTSSDDPTRANNVQILGVNQSFYKIGQTKTPFADESGAIILNTALASKLNAAPGDEVVIRIAKPSLMPREIPLTPDSDLSVSFRLKVKAIAGRDQFGDFSLQANNLAPLNAFVSLKWLQQKLDRPDRANLVLIGQTNSSSDISIEQANIDIAKVWQLADAGLQLKTLSDKDKLELRSDQVFIDRPISDVAYAPDLNATAILTYFVNELRLGDKVTPYSVVAAISPTDSAGSIVPLSMADDEILINQWLANDLSAKKGDTIELTYYVIAPTRQLVETTSTFRVHDILAMAGKAIDPDLMPDFPGLTNVQNCRDWRPGIPIDLDKIRPKDEKYWDKYRGTPKAFVTLAAGQKMWANRYGNLTAIRYPLDVGLQSRLTHRLLTDVKPASLGLLFVPVRHQALAASTQSTDFGQLFIGFSMFLIVAAIILMALLFAFGVEKRAPQTGMLLAIGFPPKLVKRLLLLEGVTLAAGGAILGALCGLLYTEAMIFGLTTIWSGAISGSWLTFHARWSTLFLSALAGLLVSVIAIWFTLRKQLRQSPRDLLDENAKWQFLTYKGVSKGRLVLVLAAVFFASAIALLALLGTGASAEAAAAFFGAGALLLISGILLANWLLKQMAASLRASARSISGLALRNSTRRSGRSLAVITLLAAGVFLVIAVGANRQNPLAHADERDSGTGGFALYAEASIPILYDLNTPAGRESLAFRDDELAGVSFVQLRLRQGDDASCFNLNRAQTPRLLGVEPEQLKSRNAFLFTNSIDGSNTWDLLNSDLGENIIPAVGDSATITWALGKIIGDDIIYTDDAGNQLSVRLAGILKNSILQGGLLISEQNFIRHFGSEPGYQVFLIDAPADKTESVSRLLSDRLRDFGFDVTGPPRRLAAFSAVENTYLSIFQMLGGLGLILGSLGLAMVVLRNVLDRRGELAMLRAVGFDKNALKSMVFSEHATLMAAGLALGTAAAIVAVAPALSSPGAEVPYVSLALTITAIAATAVLWIWLAASLALSGNLLDALRSE